MHYSIDCKVFTILYHEISGTASRLKAGYWYAEDGAAESWRTAGAVAAHKGHSQSLSSWQADGRGAWASRGPGRTDDRFLSSVRQLPAEARPTTKIVHRYRACGGAIWGKARIRSADKARQVWRGIRGMGSGFVRDDSADRVAFLVFRYFSPASPLFIALVGPIVPTAEGQVTESGQNRGSKVGPIVPILPAAAEMEAGRSNVIAGACAPGLPGTGSLSPLEEENTSLCGRL